MSRVQCTNRKNPRSKKTCVTPAIGAISGSNASRKVGEYSLCAERQIRHVNRRVFLVWRRDRSGRVMESIPCVVERQIRQGSRRIRHVNRRVFLVWQRGRSGRAMENIPCVAERQIRHVNRRIRQGSGEYSLCCVARDRSDMLIEEYSWCGRETDQAGQWRVFLVCERQIDSNESIPCVVERQIRQGSGEYSLCGRD
ncbi:hypothetical protein J6590_070309 [Homalodisca vitripennis]|nr:hypothetical protein J6590_070309 [Homalodisca vitripennis]